MSDLQEYLDLVKSQNRAIATLRCMMERGYFIIFLADVTQFNIRLHSGRWVLCKYSVPNDKHEGIVLFDNYDDAYEKAQYLIWVDRDLPKNCDTVHPLGTLSTHIRKITVKE